MRRGLSILLVLLFSLGPLNAVLGARSQSRLPACCRRLGAHHCVLAAMTAKLQSSSAPAFTTPSTCPRYPGQSAVLLTAPLAIATPAPGLPVFAAFPLAIAACLAAPLSSLVPGHAGRGPPLNLAD